jgi:hypothetical protein
MMDSFLNVMLTMTRDSIIRLISIGRWIEQERNRRRDLELQRNVEGENR